MTRRLRRVVGSVGLVAVCTLALLGATSVTPAHAKGDIVVAAASDLRPAFTELAASFEKATGSKITLSFGSSGQLAQQLKNGAPFQVFASASAQFVDDVLSAGVGDPKTKEVYAYGRLVVFAPGRRVTLGELADPSIKRIVIANPAHAPYGKAAVEALTAAGVYAAVKDRLVLAESVGDALRIAQSGNAEAGIVARSLAPDGMLVAESLHAPIAQTIVVTDAKSPTARRFVAYVRGPIGRAALARAGFRVPTH